MLKLLNAVVHIIRLLDSDIQLIAWGAGDPKTRFGDIGRPHNDPAIRMLIILGREAEVELRMERLSRMDTHLKTP